MKKKENELMIENLADLDVVIGNITQKPEMKITKVEYDSRTSAVVAATIATGLPAEMDIHDVITTTVGWLIDQGYIQIPDLPDGEDLKGNMKFRKISEDAIIGALKDSFDASYKKEIMDYLMSKATDGKALISVKSCWLDPTVKFWFVSIVINDSAFLYVPVGV